jgi:hypothetical protein
MALSVFEMASGHVKPAGKSVPGGRGGSIGGCWFELSPGCDCCILLLFELSLVLLFPPPPLLSLDQSTRNLRPMISWSLRLRTAEAAASGSANSRKPKPFGLPVSLSCTSLKLFTEPTLPNVSMICSSLTPVSRSVFVAYYTQGRTRTVRDVADEHDSSILFGCHDCACDEMNCRCRDAA